MPITNNNIRNVTKTTSSVLSWLVLIWCVLFIISSTIMLILGNEVFQKSKKDHHGIIQVSSTRFKRRQEQGGIKYNLGPAPTTNNSLFYDILSKMTLRNYNVIVTCVLIFHIVVTLIVLGRM